MVRATNTQIHNIKTLIDAISNRFVAQLRSTPLNHKDINRQYLSELDELHLHQKIHDIERKLTSGQFSCINNLIRNLSRNHQDPLHGLLEGHAAYL
jgi:hypothetical protein